MHNRALLDDNNMTPADIATRLAALLPATAAIWWWLDYPAYHFLLAALAAGYTILLVARPLGWIAVLPAALPVLDMTMWTGRFFFTVFDFLVLVTIANIWAAGRFRWRHLLARRAIVLLAISMFLAVAAGLLDTAPYKDLQSFADYNSPFNALRVGKGFLWAWLLWGAWRSARPGADRSLPLAGRYLIYGITIGLLANGLGVLWERGVLAALFDWRGVYPVISALLDLSTAERATGLFSDMHTGGSAFDGYLALTVPFALAIALAGPNAACRLLALAGVLAGGYAATVSFSRGVLAGISAAGIGVAGLYATRFSGHRYKPAVLAATAGTVILFLVMLLAMRAVAGLQGQSALMAAPALLALTQAAGLSRSWRMVLAQLVMAGLLWAIGDAMGESKWRDALAGGERVLALTILALGLVLMSLLARRLVQGFGTRRAAAGLAIAGVLLGAVAIGAGSYRLGERFSESEEDLDARRDHWRLGASLNDGSVSSLLFGEGAGSFPRRYFAASLGDRSLLTYRITESGGGRQLLMGAGDFQLAQRIDLSGHAFPLTLIARIAVGAGDTRMGASLCRRNVITQVRGGRTCERQRLRAVSDGPADTYSARFDGSRLGPDGLGKLPATLRFGSRMQTPVAIDRLSLIDAEGREVIRNADFEDGLDFWIFVSDFDHLPWHAKNLWLHLYVEQGLLGVGAFTLALVLAMRRSLRRIAEGDAMALAVLGALAAFALTGLFTTLLNVPRVAFLAYFMIFIGLDMGPRPTANPDDPARKQ